MGQGQWLRDGERLPDGETAAFLYVAGDCWQLYTTASGGYALAVRRDLHEKWIRKGLLEEGLFFPAKEDLLTMSVPAGETISSVEFGPFPQTAEPVRSFAKALKLTASRTGEDLADGIYISRFGMILPAFSGKGDKETDRILGSWICGGMNLSLRDGAHMRKYAPWLPDSVREDLMQMFGLKEMGPSEDTVLRMPEPFQGDGRKETLNSAQFQGAGELQRRPRQEGPFILRGRETLEKFIREELLDVIDREEEYRRFGVEFPGATLLYGPSGSGKTFAVEKLAEYLGWPVLRINSGSIGSKYVHETSRKISEMFDAAIQNAPSILIIDELEAFLSDRERAGGSAEIHTEEVDEFLRRIPDAAGNHVLLFGMTNLPDSLDKAVLRKGRFDHILEVGMPDTEEVLSVLEGLLEDLPTAPGLALRPVAGRLSGRPLSDVAFVVKEAGRICVHDGKKRIDQETLEEACRQLQPAAKKKNRIGF